MRRKVYEAPEVETLVVLLESFCQSGEYDKNVLNQMELEEL